MRRLLLLTLILSVPSIAHASLPPPLPSAKTPAEFVSFAPPPSEVTCTDRQLKVVESAPFRSRILQTWVPPISTGPTTPASPRPPAAEAYVFSVDAEGAVIDLKRAAAAASWQPDEQAATLATWRFAPRAPATGCRLDLPPTTTALDETAPARLFEMIALEGRSTPTVVRETVSKWGDCGQVPRRRPHVVVYPDLRAFDDKGIAPAWAAITYGIDAVGAMRDVRIVAQGGDKAFADGAAAALAETQSYPGPPRRGCYATFSASPRSTPAPKRPESQSFRRNGDACEVTQAALNIPEAKMYPPVYAARKVGGWALIRFDVAPWGAVGNIEVLASQPSDAFGLAARNLVSAARPTPPASGYRGCIVPVIYAVPPPVEDTY